MAKGFHGHKSRSLGHGRDASPKRPSSGKRGRRGEASPPWSSKPTYDPGLAPQRTLSLRNRQRVRRVNLRLLRRIIEALLGAAWPHSSFDLAIYIVAEPEMTRLNETFLRHKGCTDVITFDYAEEAGLTSGLSTSRMGVQGGIKLGRDASPRRPHPPEYGHFGEKSLPWPGGADSLVQPAEDSKGPCPAQMHGEIFVCLEEAVSQARRFHTTWQRELVRYVVHGVLHLLGYDDAATRARQRMKEAEDTLVRRLARRLPFDGLGVTT
jgi:rRNA maturation RNase YbeY